MTEAVITVLLWFSALGCGLLAGLYFTFSAFVMTALGRIEQERGISAMNAINATILRSLFMPMFMGTTLASFALAILAIVRWGQPESVPMFAGGLLYVTGMFVVTMVFNVPLNNALAAVDPAGTEAASVWRRYLKDWTLWNHVRTVSCIGTTALFIAAIASK